MDIFCYIMIIVSAYMVFYLSYNKIPDIKDSYRGLYIGLWSIGTIIWIFNFIINGT